jgi:transcriptional regulator with XRE-family HTH domain
MTAERVGNLASLIEDLAYEKGWSFREVARRSDLPAATVQKIVWRNGITVPRRETLDALARGLGVPVTLLLDAAARDSGLKAQATDGVDADIQVTIAVMEELPPERRAEIAALAKAMLNSHRNN